MVADNDPILVFSSEDGIEAMLYRTMLQEAGLDVVTDLGATEPPELFTMGARPVRPCTRLYVRAEDAERAQELLDTYRQEVESGALALDDEESMSGTPPAAVYSFGERGALQSPGQLGVQLLRRLFYALAAAVLLLVILWQFPAVRAWLQQMVR
ncbi:MAG TPA: hypothetical protein VGL77_17110 [Armatimonadota bacterium]|jgi:hypothetical protein